MLCNQGVKPTGNSGEKSTTRRAQEIYECILVKESVGNFSGNDSSDDEKGRRKKRMNRRQVCMIIITN